MEKTPGIDFVATLLPAAVVIFIITIGVVLLTQQFRKNLYKQRLEREELKNNHQKELLNSSILAQEEERKRIARDMHDELGALLSMTRMHLIQTERRYGGESEKLLADLQNIRTLTETSLTNMRRISHELMPPLLETFGLTKTLQSVAEQINKSGQIQLDLEISATLRNSSWVIQLALYRIFMELVNNTIKHAGATTILMELTCEQEYIVATYSDNGKGISQDRVRSGIGLMSIEGRINALGGTIETGNNPMGGFKTLIKIPFAS